MTRSRKARRGKLDIDRKDCRSWANLHDDLLVLIANMLGVIDYIAFGCVCTSWRRSAVSQRESFMASQPPYLVSISVSAKRGCYLNDVTNGKRYKTMLPDLRHTECLGSSCGYLIMAVDFGFKIWLINLITRAELHFPRLIRRPRDYGASHYRAVLAFSTSLAGFVLVVVSQVDKYLQFCRYGDAEWTLCLFMDKPWLVTDVAVFRGKLYVVADHSRIAVLKLSPSPVLTLLDVGSTLTLFSCNWQLVASTNQLFIVDHYNMRVSAILKLDFSKMEWVRVTDLGDETIFVDTTCSSAVFNVTKRAFPVGPVNCLPGFSIREVSIPSRQRRVGELPIPRGRKYLKYERLLWYFPHQCYNKNLLNDDGA